MSEILETSVEETVTEPQEMTERPAEKRKKVPLTHRTPVKVVAFIVLMIMAAAASLGVVAAVVMADEGIYLTAESAYRESVFQNLTPEEMRQDWYRRHWAATSPAERLSCR